MEDIPDEDATDEDVPVEDASDEESSSDMEPLEEPRAAAWAPIENQISAARLEAIWKFDQENARKKCLAKFRITYSQLRAIRRHFTYGTGEHVKYWRIRSHVGAQFKEVDHPLFEFVEIRSRLFYCRILMLSSPSIGPSV